MGKKNMSYQNGKIFKIVNDINDNVYIGATTATLKEKYARLKIDIKRPLGNIPGINILLKDHFNIVLIENYPCKNKEELNRRQLYYVLLLNAKNEIKF